MAKAHVSCGIDFGTSNSSLAYNIDGKAPQLSIQENNKPIIPSALFFPEKRGGKAQFGNQAMQSYVGGHHGRFMRSLKRVLGTSLMESGTVINGSRTSFENVLSLFIGRMKQQAEAECGETIEHVVMGRPVHFRDNDAKGDKQAERELHSVAKSVGFKHIEFQFEPIAAAFAHEADLKHETLAVVVDIGGGTSDFSVIRIGGERVNKIDRKEDILANSGMRIGGNDFDKDLSLASFMPELGYRTKHGGQGLDVPQIYFHEMSEWSMINMAYTHQNINSVKRIIRDAHEPEKLERFVDILEHEAGHRLLMDVEGAKIALTDNVTHNVTADYILDKPTFTVNRDGFDAAIHVNIQSITRSMLECIQQAGLRAADIELVIMTGGSTEIPYLQQAFMALLPNAKLSQGNKLSSVGLGLAYDARGRF